MTSPTTNKFSAEVRERGVRMVLEPKVNIRRAGRGSQGSACLGMWNAAEGAMLPIAAKFGCSPHTLREWVQKADRDSGRAPGVPSEVSAKLKAGKAKKVATTAVMRRIIVLANTLLRDWLPERP